MIRRLFGIDSRKDLISLLKLKSYVLIYVTTRGSINFEI